jgi:hypothetical protein
LAELFDHEKCSIQQVKVTIARLSPAVERRLPAASASKRLRDLPTEWSRQFEALRLNPE